MTDEAKRVEIEQASEYLREDACASCIFNSYIGECTSVSDCYARKAADLIEALSAELEQVEHKLTELLYYVTGGRFSKIEYSTDDMRRFVEDYFQSVCEECPELEDVKRERDAAIEELRGMCYLCTHFNDNNFCFECMHFCPFDDECFHKDHWQWRGPQEVPHD